MSRGVLNLSGHFKNVFMRTFMYGMVGSLAMFITSWEKTDRVKDKFLDKNREYGDTYDFIVVGGGSAGSLLSNRLSSHYKVLLVEAGGDPHPFHSIPFLANFMGNYKETDWMHKSVPQKHAFFGSLNNEAGLSAGLSLGGTSNLDYMMYLRGSPQDYDHWAEVTGDPSWSYHALMKYFKKHERYNGPWKDKKFHGEDGEISIGVSSRSPLGKRFCKGGTEMGYSQVDLNGQFSQGFDMMSNPRTRGYRQSAYKSFLKRAQDRWNLVIHKYAHVNRVLTRGEPKEAYAVEYFRHGTLRYAYAKKEIILCAGAIQSPKILLLSGIGEKGALEALGIPSVVNLPHVGHNLQDHMAVHLGPFFTHPKETMLLDRDLTPPALFQYAMSNGPLTSTGYEAAAMLTSDLSKISGNANWPDIQLTLNGMAQHDTADTDFAHAHRMRRDLISDYFKNSKGRDSFSIVVSASRPLSRGAVTLRDKDPYSPPLIDPRYLERVEDVGIMIDGIKKSMRLVENTLSFRQIGSKFTEDSVQGCTQYKFKSDDYWSCFVRLMSISMGDLVGTAAMGSVVNSQLAVHGLSRLRVIDASVMPTIVSSNTGAATLVIAEKGADMILKFWGNPDKQKGYLKESEKVKGILKASADKLKALDSSQVFLNGVKDTSTFKELDPTDVNKVIGKNRPLTSAAYQGQRGGNPLYPMNSLNPFKLIGAMFKNSVNLRNESGHSSAATFEPVATHIPYYLTPPSVPPRTTSTSTKRPSVDTLFRGTNQLGHLQGYPQGYITYPVEEVVVSTTPEPISRTTEAAALPYTLSPKPIAYAYENEIPSVTSRPESLVYHPTESFESAVDSIISKTLPIIQDSERARESPFHLFSTAGRTTTTTSRPLTSMVARRETPPSALRGHIQEILKAPSTTAPPPPVTTLKIPVTISTVSTTTSTSSPFKVLMENPLKFVRNPLEEVIRPLTHISNPFSKYMKLPFDGFFTRFTSKANVTDASGSVETTIAPEPLKSSLLTSKSTERPRWNLIEGVDSKVKNILSSALESDGLISTSVPWTSVTQIPISFSDKIRGASGRPLTYYAYESHVTGSDNTFKYKENSTVVEVEKPVKDYELMEEGGNSSIDELSEDKSPTLSPSLQPLQIEANYKIIYSGPTTMHLSTDNVQGDKPSFVSNYGPNLAANVGQFLKASQTSKPKSPFVVHNSAEAYQTSQLSSLHFHDGKNLDEEIGKLLTSSSGGDVRQKSDPVTGVKETLQGRLKEAPSDDVSFSKSVVHILKESSKQFNLGGRNEEKLRSLSESSTNHLDSFKGNDKPKEKDKLKPLWPTEEPNADHSFRIKILNL